MIKLVKDFWRQGQMSSGPPEDVVGGLPGIVGEEERIIVFDGKEETSTKKEETIEAEEDEVRGRDCTLFPGSNAEGVG